MWNSAIWRKCTEDAERISASIISLDEFMGTDFGDSKVTLNSGTYLPEYAASYFETFYFKRFCRIAKNEY